MGYEIKNLSISMIASSSYGLMQYRGVRASTVADHFSIGATTTQIFPLGILQNNPSASEAGEIWIPGCISKIETGTALAIGARFHIVNNGRAYSTASVALGSALYGPVLSVASGSSQIVTVSFTPFGITT
jgi:hypothetical protein